MSVHDTHVASSVVDVLRVATDGGARELLRVVLGTHKSIARARNRTVTVTRVTASPAKEELHIDSHRIVHVVLRLPVLVGLKIYSILFSSSSTQVGVSSVCCESLLHRAGEILRDTIHTLPDGAYRVSRFRVGSGPP